VAWCGFFSEYFLATNGVKQGGVLSPVLFCVYLDVLLVALSKAGVGCYVGSVFVGALAYADDLVLIAPSATALRKLLSICDTYAHEYSMSFNAQKSKCLVILPRTRRFLAPLLNDCRFQIGGNNMEMVSSYCHLGHIVTSNLDDSLDIINRQSSFTGQVNSLLCSFGDLSCDVKIRLFRSYCFSLYGCELWDLSSCQLSDFCARWRKCVRRILNLPLQTHCYLLPLLCGCLSVFEEICRRILNFVKSCLCHQSGVVRSIVWYSVTHGLCRSPVGRNVLFCLRRFNCNFDDVFTFCSADSIICSYVAHNVTDTQRADANVLAECLRIQDGTLQLPDGFLHSDVADVVMHLCTSDLVV